jgi:hypothetical protein
MNITIESGKFYLKLEDGSIPYVIDAVRYNPEREDYILFEANELPVDILNRCYILRKEGLILDEEKHKLFIEEQEAFAKQFAGDEDV